MKKENDVLELEKSSKTGFILLFLVFLLLIGGGVYYYFAYFNNPTYIVTKGIEKFATVYNSENNFDVNQLFRIRGGLEFDLKVNDEEMQNIYDVFNDLEILYNIDADMKNEIISTKLSSKYSDKELINAKLYQEKNEAYIFLEDLYDKYIAFNELVVKEEITSKYDMEDIEIIINGLLNVFKDAFLEDDFYREKEEITHNDEKIEVYKNYIAYNKDNYKKINDRVVKSIKENKELLNSLNKIVGEDKVKELLDDITNMKDIKDFKGEFIIYTKGYNNEFVKTVLKLDDKEDYLIIEASSEEEMLISLMGDGIDMKLTIEQNEQNNFVYNFNVVDEEMGNIFIKVSMIFENIKNIEKINTENAISYDKLSEDDITKIMEKISKNEAINKIINDLSGVLNSDFALSM